METLPAQNQSELNALQPCTSDLPPSLGARSLTDKELAEANELNPTGYTGCPQPPHASEGHSFEFSLFPCQNNPHGTREIWAYETALERFTTYDPRPAKDGPLVSAAIYRDGPIYRKCENVVALSCLFADCDESHTLAELDAIIAPMGVKALIFPSHSHGKPDTKKHPNAHAPGQRFRIWFPLESPLAVAHFPEAWERLNLLLGGTIDAACKDPSRAYFLPSHPHPEGLIFKSYEGRLLRVDDLPALCEKSSVSSDKHESSGESQNQDASQLSEGSSRPGDDYNARATNEDTAQILERHGWAVTRSDSPLWKARRPNKEDEGDSATIGHYGAGQLFVFSSNAAPFKEGRNYKPFQVKAILDHHGDYKSAARDLAQRSFGNAQPSGVAPNDQNSQRHETGQTEDGSPLDASRIPAPSFRNERGALEYEPAQLVELIHPNWGCASLSSEAAHANRIRDAYGHDTRYSPNLGWVTFDGRQFQRDDRHSTQTTHKVAALSRVVREEAGQLYEFAGELARMGRGSDAEAMSRAAASHTRYAKQVEQRKYVQEALKFAAGDPQIRVSPDAFDQRPYVLGFANGVWDKGVFREHRREDMMLHLCPVTYDCKADQREWQQLLDRMSGGDDDFKRSLQDVAGYILSGASNLRFLPWLYGPKATGKSTFAELIQTVLGPMAMVIDPKKMGADSARERLGADLYNRRLAICAEAGNQKLDGELLKTLSGSDTLSVRFLYQEAFDALPRHTLLMVSNDAPNLDAYDDALKDRVLAFPFEHRLDEGGRLELTGGARIESVRKDTQSPLLRGFVAWAVEGMARVLETQTIFRAPCIEAATAQFWQDADLLTPFWENYSQAELRAGVANGALRSSYQLWCEDEGFRPLGGKNFARACKSRGLVQKFRGPANNRVRVWFLEQTPSGKASPRRSSSDCEHNAHNGAVFSKPSIAVTESHREVCKNSPDSVHSVHSVDNPVAEEPEGDGQYGGQWNYGVRKLTVQEMCDQLGI